jgi:2-hydroxychromene-2-carboxylate isomerase
MAECKPLSASDRQFDELRVVRHAAATYRGAIEDFLKAVDRGYFGDDFRIGPPDQRVESAFVRGLREALNRGVTP